MSGGRALIVQGRNVFLDRQARLAWGLKKRRNERRNSKAQFARGRREESLKSAPQRKDGKRRIFEELSGIKGCHGERKFGTLKFQLVGQPLSLFDPIQRLGFRIGIRGAQWKLAGQNLEGRDRCLIVRHVLYECEWMVGKRSEPRSRVDPQSENKDDYLCNLKAIQMSQRNAEVCGDIEKEAALACFPRAWMMLSRFRGLCKGIMKCAMRWT